MCSESQAYNTILWSSITKAKLLSYHWICKIWITIWLHWK